MNIRELFFKISVNANYKSLQKVDEQVSALTKKFSILSTSSKLKQPLSPELTPIQKENIFNQAAEQARKQFEYEKDLSQLSSSERKEIKLFNKTEKTFATQLQKQTKEALKEQIKLRKLELAPLLEQERIQKNLFRYKNYYVFKKFLAGYSYYLGFLSVTKNIRSTLEEINRFKQTRVTENTLFSKSDIKTAITFAGSLNQLLRRFRDLRNILTIKIMDRFGVFFQFLNKGFSDNAKVIKSTLLFYLDVLITSVEALFLAFKKLKQALDPIISKFGGWHKIIGTILGGLLLSWTFSIVKLFVKFGLVLLNLTRITKIFNFAIFGLTGGFTGLVTVTQLLNKIMKVGFLSWFGRGGIFGLIIAGIGYLLTESDTLWSTIQNQTKNFADSIKNTFSYIFEYIAELKNSFIDLFSKKQIEIAPNNNVKHFKYDAQSQKFLLQPDAASKNKQINNYAPTNNINIKIEAPNTIDSSFNSSELKNEFKKIIEYENQKFLAAIGVQV